jgi:hypothetical protein
MPTQLEEEQAKEFLKRAEIRTMRKDLLALREADSVKERDKIAHIKTLEEQLADQQKATMATQATQVAAEKDQRSAILEKHEGEEASAEENLKQYATEEERQKIFLFESQKLQLTKQAEKIDTEEFPKLELEKNGKLLELKKWQDQLAQIVTQETQLENEQKLVAEKAKASTVDSERKSLEARRWELDGSIQETEKKRWEVEKQIKTIQDSEVVNDQSSQALTLQRNQIRDTILGIEKSLRDLYSGVVQREDLKKQHLLADQQQRETAAATQRAKEREDVRREQWKGKGAQQPGFLDQAPENMKASLEKSAASEEEQRKKFLSEVDQATQQQGSQQQEKSNIQP